MRNAALAFWVSVLLLAVLSYGGYSAFNYFQRAAEASDGAGYGPIDTGGGTAQPFKLTDQAGNEWDSKQMEGKVWVASFFFASCPQICFQLNQALAKLQEDPRFKDVKFVSITCDPENDRPPVLTEYAKKFAADHSRWTFLTGDLETVTKVGEDLKITVLKQTHSDRLILIDRNGEIRGRFRGTVDDQVELVKKTLVKLLDEPVKPVVETK